MVVFDKKNKMVSVGQSFYNSLIMLAYHFLTASIPKYQQGEDVKQIDIRDAVVSNGYKFDEYELKTPDGYFLSLFRVRKLTNNETVVEDRPPVLLVHGILSSAYDWLVMGPKSSLGYLLADRGYDVWLGNCRGNRYSRKHVKYHPDQQQFWSYSFHQIGYYDIPTKIDFITKTTGHKDIYYIGHSQGTTSMFVTASERPEYIKNIRLFVGLAPVVFTKTMPSILSEIMATFYKQIERVIYAFEYYEVFPHTNELQQNVFRLFCDKGMPFSRLCWTIMRTSFGYSKEYESVSITDLLVSAPGGCSIHQIFHFIQMKLSDRFCQYDYGAMVNLIKYGKLRPPRYNLRTVLPTALFYSDNDWLSTEEDVERTSCFLKNLKFKHKTNANHVDYIFGYNTTNMLIPLITKLFDEN